MLAIFEDGCGEVLICEVDTEGTPITEGYFKGDSREKNNYDLKLVEGPIMVTPGSLKTEPERILTS